MQKKAVIRAPIYAIAILSAAAMAYEVLLMRLFSIIQWHHFAYMIISLALLGYGISGTFIAIFAKRLLAHFPLAFVVNIVLFALTSMGAFLIAQQIPFNAQEIFWDSDAGLWLLLYFILFTLPFFFVANAIGMALSHHGKEVSRLYAADMIGAGVGSLGLIGLLYWLYPTMILQIVASIGFISALVAAWEIGWSGMRKGMLSAMVVLPFVVPPTWIELHISPYKALSKVLQIKDTHIVAERSGPLGIVTVVESPTIPFRYAPGVSVKIDIEPPEQLGIFTNGEGMSAITRFPKELEKVKYLDYQSFALGYHLKKMDRVMVVGAGGGADVLQSLYHHIPRIEVLEMDENLIDLVKYRFADFAGDIYNRSDVSVHIAEARGYFAATRNRYDLIQFALIDSFGATSTGLYALSENYLYTVEAFKSYLAHLREGGYVSVTRWVKLPPRDTLRLFATAAEALHQSGYRAQKSLLLIRGWQTATLLVKKGSVTSEEIMKLKRFCSARNFDLVYYPGIRKEEANRFNILREPYFYEATKALLAGESFFDTYKFDIRPICDDKPYFYHFFKWKSLPEIFSLRGSGGLYLMEWGYVILVFSLAVAVIISLVLILLPLLFYHKSEIRHGAFGKVRLIVYFFALGIAFLFLEITFMQRFILFLSHPIFAATIVLSAFLVFAGLGSRYSGESIAQQGYYATLKPAVVAIIFLGLLYLTLLPELFAMLIGLPFLFKSIVSLALIAPLAFAMGIPFPVGVAYLAEENDTLIPWAWGINGAASVISAILATLLAIHLGFTLVALVALLAYGVALVEFPKR